MTGWRAIAAVILLAGCQTHSWPGTDTASTPVFDGHSDFAVHYARSRPAWSATALNLSDRLPGQADVPRWRAGGVYGMLVTIGSDLGPGGRNHFPRVTIALDWLEALAGRHADDIVLVRTAAELRQARVHGRIGLIAAIEGGDQIDNSIDNLRAVYARGVRSLLLVYDHHNALGDGAMVLEQSDSIAGTPHGGLSDLGRRVTAEMNSLGMLIDLSHASEQTAQDVLAISTAPVIFSHSAARALADTPRNLTDETLRQLAANGGLVMVPMAPYLSTTEHWRWWASGEAQYVALVQAYPENEGAVERGMADWDRVNPQPVVTVSDVADQVDYIAGIVGRDHVGIGSDFDGMGPFVVQGLEDAADMQSLLAELRRRGWSRAEIEGFAGRNFERVFSEVEGASR